MGLFLVAVRLIKRRVFREVCLAQGLGFYHLGGVQSSASLKISRSRFSILAGFAVR